MNFFKFFQKKIDLVQRSGSWRDTLQCKLLELNCSLLNYTGKGEYENEYEDEYDLKKWRKSTEMILNKNKQKLNYW